jgi:hypothetical protein
MNQHLKDKLICNHQGIRLDLITDLDVADDSAYWDIDALAMKLRSSLFATNPYLNQANYKERLKANIISSFAIEGINIAKDML